MSLLIAIVMTALAIEVASRGKRNLPALAGGVILGIGVAAMHYLGMLAVEIPGRIEWSADLVVGSIVVGVAMSASATFVAAMRDTKLNLFAGTILLTLSIVALHFTGMAAVRIVPDPTREIAAFAFSPSIMATAIAGISVALLGIGLLTAIAARKLSGQASAFAAEIGKLKHSVERVTIDIEEAKKREASFRNLLDNNPIPMWVYDPETLRFLDVNSVATDHYGYSREKFLAMSVLDLRPREDWDKIREASASGAEMDSRGSTWRHVKADGSLIEVAIYSRALQYQERDAVDDPHRRLLVVSGNEGPPAPAEDGRRDGGACPAAVGPSGVLEPEAAGNGRLPRLPPCPLPSISR